MNSDNKKKKRKEKRDLPVDLQSQKTPGNKKKKKMNSTNKNTDAKTSKSMPIEKKNIKPKQITISAVSSSTYQLSSEAFDFDEIASNKEASALIHELVKCYTDNSLLAPEELLHLNQTLYEKTVSVLISVLNSCVQKILNKVLNSEYFRDLLEKNKVVKKSVWCQTDMSYGSF